MLADPIDAAHISRRRLGGMSMKPWRECVVGAVSGAVAAWIVMILAQTYRTAGRLLVDPGVVGAGLGAFLAIAGGIFLQRHSQRMALKRTKLMIGQASFDLANALKEHQTYMGNFIWVTLIEPRRAALGSSDPTIDTTAVGRANRDIASKLETACKLFDDASTALWDEPVYVLQLREMKRLLTEAGDGLFDIEDKVYARGVRSDAIAQKHGQVSGRQHTAEHKLRDLAADFGVRAAQKEKAAAAARLAAYQQGVKDAATAGAAQAATTN